MNTHSRTVTRAHPLASLCKDTNKAIWLIFFLPNLLYVTKGTAEGQEGPATQDGHRTHEVGWTEVTELGLSIHFEVSLPSVTQRPLHSTTSYAR